jgi:nitrate reductase (cytochrome), electron transfer subunit
MISSQPTPPEPVAGEAPQLPLVQRASISHILTIAGAIAVGIGLVGFLVGIAEPVTPQRAQRRVPATTGAIAVAPTYDQLARPERPRRFQGSEFAALKRPCPGLFDPVVRTPEMKAEALRDRLRTRSFDGAPPVIPHAVDPRSSAGCLACHANGLRLGEQVATRVSHRHFTNCTQCHVAASPLPALEDDVGDDWPSPNEFAGLPRSGPGTRAMPAAPPMIPHATHLREDCMSCHGLIARPGLRTTHPWLRNCAQCHVAAARPEAGPWDAAAAEDARASDSPDASVYRSDRSIP